MIYNVIDLFAGAGGLSLGFKQTGQVKIVAAAENNLNTRKTYKRNFKLARLYSDVRTIDYAELQDTVGPVDIVIGGPPCQGFSNANRQHTTVISMNNRLVKEYVRAICELNPKAFVMENVVSLQRMGTYSFIIAVICLVRTILYITIAMLTLVLVFVIAGLFSKVLAFVFKQAIQYKEENDLTI